jgi:anti-sigma factor RsiW
MMADKFIKEPFEPDEKPGPAAPPAVEEEFVLLMSLALDDLLDADERARFQAYQAAYPGLAAEWRSWQALDAELRATPSALPPAGFVSAFEAALLQRERRRRLWWGAGFALAIVLLSVVLIAGVAFLGAFVMFTQPAWLTELARMAAQTGALVNGGIVAVLDALGSLAGTEQARAFVMVYLFAAAALLAGWVFLLRRTTRFDIASRTA